MTTWVIAWYLTQSVSRRPGGKDVGQRGVYREVVVPERIVNTESWGGDWADTVNTLVLTETDGQTTMVSTSRYPSLEARDAALGSGMKDGMNISYNRLDAHLASVS